MYLPVYRYPMAEVRIRSSDARSKQKEREKTKKSSAHTRRARVPRPPRLPPPEDEAEEAKSEVLTDSDRDTAPDVDKWPTRAEVARRIGVNKTTIIRWQKDGELDAVLDKDSVWRFDPDDVEELASRRGTDAAQMMGQSVAMVVNSAADLTGKAQEHAQAFADKHLAQSDIAFEQMRLMSETLREENNSLRSYIRELEGDRVEARKKIEAAESKVHERSLAELEVTTRERRLDWAIGAFIQLAGPSIAMKLGLDVKSLPPIPGLGTLPTGVTSSPETPTPPTGLSEPKGMGPIGTNDPATVQDMIRLETNCIMLIGNIEEHRIKMLCKFSNPDEAEALMEIWNTVQRLRKQAQASQPQQPQEKK